MIIFITTIFELIITNKYNNNNPWGASVLDHFGLLDEINKNINQDNVILTSNNNLETNPAVQKSIETIIEKKAIGIYFIEKGIDPLTNDITPAIYLKLALTKAEKIQIVEEYLSGKSALEGKSIVEMH